MGSAAGQRLIRTGLIMVVLTTALALPAAATPAGNSGPPPMLLTSGGKTVRAAGGTFCWATVDPGGETVTSACADAAYPLAVRCRLPAKRGTRLKIDLGTPADRISVDLILPNAESEYAYSRWSATKQSRKGRSKWVLGLPRAVRGAIAVEVSADYPQGHHNTWTGLANEVCRSERPPSPTG